jgi:putative ABC transport system substrate-binding protein
MNRRTFLCGLTLGTLRAPLVAQAQQAGRLYRVGFLVGTSVPELFEAFRQGLRELGWTEGQNVVLEYRSAESRLERIPEIAAELVRRKVDIIVLAATALPYARQATANVPAVFVIADDPVSAGYVASLARPGGRMTGLTSLNVDLDAKRLEILKTAFPGVSRVGVLSAPKDRTHSERVAAAERGARSLGLQLQILEVPSADLLPSAFDAARRARVEAVMVLGSPFLFPHQGRIAELATKARLPVVSAWREFPDAGGLISYGTSVSAMFCRAASYVDRILKGANLADLPVEQATTFELLVNLKTAKALGLTIPSQLLARADLLIE